ncbi:MAG: GNAT family N-acetyltransferase [Alphaproteobacteria bacterium]|nr:GNAT family N-acetyltransferase [Alphaproteobacteria bacterium]
MIRRVFSLQRGMMSDCFFIANQFVDAQNVISWHDLGLNIEAEKLVLFVDENHIGYLRGFLLGKIQSNEAVVDSLYVDKKEQRVGVGGGLLQVYEDFAKRCGVKTIKLQSRPTKQAAEFYQKHGYVKVSAQYHMQKSL